MSGKALYMNTSLLRAQGVIGEKNKKQRKRTPPPTKAQITYQKLVALTSLLKGGAISPEPRGLFDREMRLACLELLKDDLVLELAVRGAYKRYVLKRVNRPAAVELLSKLQKDAERRAEKTSVNRSVAKE